MICRSEILCVEMRETIAQRPPGICEVSFMSKTMEPDRWPLPSAKKIGCFRFEIGQYSLDRFKCLLQIALSSVTGRRVLE